jgi:hypothetical protein
VSTRNAIVLSATVRLGIPERRSAHAVNTSPPGAAGREQPRSGKAGHRDLVAHCPADARAAAHENTAEHRHVAGEHPERRQQRGCGPLGTPVPDPVPRLVEPRELGQQKVEREDRGQQEAGEREHVAARDLEKRAVIDVLRRLRVAPRVV